MDKRVQDLTGKKFHRLTVLEFSHSKNRKSYWKCLCECGNEKVVRSDSLKDGSVKSCGCLNNEAKVIKHGKHGSKLYFVWAGMKDRCFNEKTKHFKHYGGRGIIVCDEWSNNYDNFHEWAIKNGYEEGLTIERIDVNGNYEPENCKWITQKEQAKNTRRNRNITYKGKTQNITEWSIELGINRNTLNARLNNPNISLEEAFTKPVENKVQRLSKVN